MDVGSNTIQGDRECKGLRLDQFLCKKLPQWSRSQIARKLKEGEITSADHKRLKPAMLITGDEQLVVHSGREKPRLEAVPMDLEIIFSDDHLAIINKPKGLVVHPGAGVTGPTLCHGLLHHFPTLDRTSDDRPGIVHRLDKDTSGIMVIAKTALAHRLLSKAFHDRKIGKEYVAVAIGGFLETTFDVCSGHARHPHNRLKFFTNLPVPKSESVRVRKASTSFTVLAQGNGLGVLKANLHTGRTHQIRAHLADRGHPILGDALYGGCRTWPESMAKSIRQKIGDLKGHALHAHALSFNHPISGDVMNFVAPIEASMKEVVNEILG